MRKPQLFKTKNGDLPLPIFFPDATRGVVRTLDSTDIKNTKTPGVLVNTYHLLQDVGIEVTQKHGGIRKFMGWDGAVISDSGGFQVMTLAKREGALGRVTDRGVLFKSEDGERTLLTPEDSMRFQMQLGTDLVVVLDDFTDPKAGCEEARESVERTIYWAKRSKKEYLKCREEFKLTKETRPYIIAVVQGGDFLDLRKDCAERLTEIGFDGFGYGGWPMKDGKFNFEVAACIRENTPEGCILYGLGVGKPEDIVGCFDIGFTIFDCVLPTRDARHGRLYVYDADSIDKIDINKSKFYHFYDPGKEENARSTEPVSRACDCLLCQNYSKAYLHHLFKIGDPAALRLATIHNLRFYSILMGEL